MGYSNNSFPVFLSARTDGTFEATVRKFEDSVGSAMKNVADKATAASTVIGRQFNFTGASAQLAQFERDSLAALGRIQTAASAQLNVSSALSGLKSSPFVDPNLQKQQAAENALNDQRQRATQERIALIQAEFDAAMKGIADEQAARERAQNQGIADAKRNIAALIALDNQRTEALRAAEQARISRNTDRRSSAERLVGGEATLDRAAVAGVTLEQVLGRVSVKSREVAEAQRDVGLKSEEAMQRAAAAARQLVEEQRKLVSGREFIQAPTFDPGATGNAAAAARQHAVALTQIAEAAERVVATERNATATDRAFAAQMRESANAANIEAGRLEELAATQTRVAGAARGLSTDNLELQSGVRNTRFATLQASQQFQDFFIQLQSGQNPMVAFSQQASQLAFVMASTGGEAGKFARFMAGGWGTAIFIGLAALTPFVSKLFETDDATKKVTKSLQEQLDELIRNAREKRVSEEAENLFARSAEGAAQAIAQVTRELEAQNTTLENNLRLKRGGIELNIASITSGIGTKQEELATAEGALGTARRARDAALARIGQEGGAVAYRFAQSEFQEAEQNVYRLRQELLGLQDSLNKAQQAINRVDIQEIDRQARNTLDPIKEINDRYDEQARAAREAAVGNAALKASLDDTLLSIYRARDAELERAEAAKRAREETARGAREVVQFGPPIEGYGVNSGYSSARRSPVTGRVQPHLGLDYAAPLGTPVLAAMDGIVKFADAVAGYGNQIELIHGAGTATRYSHLSRFDVREGQQVSKGDVIGRVGSTGDSTGNHLHYEVLVNGKKVDPSKGMFAVDTTRIAEQGQRWAEQQRREAEAVAREQERLQGIYDRSAEKIADINARFDEQPRLVDQAADAARQLDTIIADLGKEQPPGFEKLIEDAERARPIIQEGLTRPLREMAESAAEHAQINALILSGDEERAEVMREIYRLESQMGQLLPQEVAAVEALVRARRLEQRALAENEKNIQRQVEAARGLQDAITGIIANPTDLNSFKDAFDRVFGDFQKQWAERISHSIFGNLGQEIEDGLRMKSDPLGAAGQQLSTSAIDLGQAAVELINAAVAQRQAAAAGPTPGQLAATPTAFGLGTGGGGAGSWDGFLRDFDAAFGVTGAASAAKNADNGLGRVGADVAGAVDAQTRLDQRRFQLEQQSALYADPVSYYNKFGAAVGGKIDQALGTGVFGKIGGKLGTALEGIQLGQVGGGIADMLGFKTSNTGAAIGGALGSLTPLGPLGGLIGGFVGGILGGLFKKTKTGVATVGGNAAGNLDVTTAGNSKTRKEAATRAADSIINPLEDLAERLGVALVSAVGAVSIGIRDKNFRVDPTGRGITKTKGGAIDFGEDQQAAVEYAMRDLIKDGVLGPIREGTKNLLLNARTLQTGIEKALKFEDVFKRLKRYTDPVGAAIDELNVEFENLRRIFVEAGATAAEYAQLEALYAYERSEAVKQSAKDMTSTLKKLLDELTYRGDTGLSLRTRERNAQAAFQPFEQQILGGQAIDQDAFAEVATSLLQIQREIYGSTKAYFDSLNYITDLTRSAITTAGGPAAVPGVTTPGAAPTAKPPSITPVVQAATGYSTTPPGGALPGAANDNSLAAAQVVAAIKEQTALMLPKLDAAALTGVIQSALIGLQTRVDPRSGATVFETRTIVSAIDRMHTGFTSRLGQLIDATEGTGERIGRFTEVATTSRSIIANDGFGVNPTSRIGLSSLSSPAYPVSSVSKGTSTFGSRFASGGA